MSKHSVIAILEAKPGYEERLLETLKAVVTPSRSEDVCLEYRLHRDKENPAQFVLYENWTDANAHQAQFSKPYILALADKAEDMLAKPFQLIMAEELME